MREELANCSEPMDEKVESSPNTVYRLYPSRWGLLATAFLLNISSNSLWISFSSVAPTTAEYYNTTVNNVDLLATIGFVLGIPYNVVSSIITSKWGLK